MEEYLAGEEISPAKREYVGGSVYPVPGESNRHNRIGGNVLGILCKLLHGKPCQPWNSATKVRVRGLEDTRFYYPDAQVVCRPNSLDDQFQDEPVVIFEVLSESTRRIDEQEKRPAYCSIPSLRACVLVEQDTPKAAVWRRVDNGFVREDYEGIDSSIPLPEIQVEMPMRGIYDGVLGP